jgi:serine/threonine-protein kinase RsbW
MHTRFELTIGSDIAEIPVVLDRFGEALQANGFSAEEILDTQLAVEEAITNVIVHGYRRTGEPISITCQIHHNRVEVRITDAAPRFDPFTVPEPELEESVEDRSIGGLGVYLIRRVMDEVSYHYRDGRNVLVMVKIKRG